MQSAALISSSTSPSPSPYERNLQRKMQRGIRYRRRAAASSAPPLLACLAACGVGWEGENKCELKSPYDDSGWVGGLGFDAIGLGSRRQFWAAASSKDPRHLDPSNAEGRGCGWGRGSIHRHTQRAHKQQAARGGRQLADGMMPHLVGLDTRSELLFRTGI